tara:strand:- start:120 stop:473 length:354 start_codon:yes stop_codon:yes gene_type:complete
MKNYKTMYENIILESIDFEGYDVEKPQTDKEKIDLVYSRFRKEFIHDNNKHISDERNFAEWLRGLPSVITVPFYNHDILEKAKEYGYRFENEWSEDVFLEMYWSRLATSFVNLKENL